jgi:hypothetical protein
MYLPMKQTHTHTHSHTHIYILLHAKRGRERKGKSCRKVQSYKLKKWFKNSFLFQLHFKLIVFWSEI